MKKVKHFLMIALAAAMVLCVSLAPASATKDFADSVGDVGKGLGIQWSTYLSVNGKSGTASITARANSSGAVPADIEVELVGEIRGGTQFETLEESSFGTAVSSVTAADSKELDDYDVTYAECRYWANGESAAILTLPKK